MGKECAFKKKEGESGCRLRVVGSRDFEDALHHLDLQVMVSER